MNYKVNDNAQRNQTKPKKNHFCYIYNKVYGGNHQQTPLSASSSNSYRVAKDAYLQQVIMSLTHSKIGLPPLGEGQGRGFCYRLFYFISKFFTVFLSVIVYFL